MSFLFKDCLSSSYTCISVAPFVIYFCGHSVLKQQELFFELWIVLSCISKRNMMFEAYQ